MTVTVFEHDHLLSERAKARSFLHFSQGPTDGAPEGFKPHPKPLALHWGMPNPGFFPIDLIDVNLVDYPFQKSLSLPTTNASVESLIPQGKSTGRSVTIAKKEDDADIIDISRGLQYSEVEGLPQLRQFARDFIKRTHAPAYSDWDVIITTGAGDGLNKSADLILDPEDVILIEEFTFSPFLSNVKANGGIAVPLKLNLDAESGPLGLDIDYLQNLLENWSELKPGLKKPKAIYTIPTGQNPTGVTQPVELRRKVYDLAVKHDFIILEDDPYGYLALPKYSKPEGLLRLGQFLEIDEYLESHLTPSYLTLDTTGRVVRIETFSKLFAPGLRLGFIVAQKRAIDVIGKYAALVTRSPSGTSQLIVQNVIQKKFGGVDGWIEWILKMRVTYAHRRDVLLLQFYESDAYKKGYLDVIDPLAGMFALVIIKFPEGTTDADAKTKLLNWKFVAFGVGVVPGANMAVDKDFSAERSNFYRITFAPANDDEELTEAGQRFVGAVEEFFEKGLKF